MDNIAVYIYGSDWTGRTDDLKIYFIKGRGWFLLFFFFFFFFSSSICEQIVINYSSNRSSLA